MNKLTKFWHCKLSHVGRFSIGRPVEPIKRFSCKLSRKYSIGV